MKITNKYVNQEYLHHRLLKNQQKIKGFLPKRKNNSDSKPKKVPYNNDHAYVSSIKGSPLLNKNEIDKRQTFKEIVNGFPFAKKQKNFVQSIHDESDPNVITDQDLERYQKYKDRHSKDKPSVRIRTAHKYRTARPGNSLDKSAKLVKQKIQIETKTHNKGIDDNDAREAFGACNTGKAIYISSRISKCIESMMDHDGPSKPHTSDHSPQKS